MASVLLLLDAGHDVNGNPRRVYVEVKTDGTISGAWLDHGQGHAALPRRLLSKPRKAWVAVRIHTTVAEYREFAWRARRAVKAKARKR